MRATLRKEFKRTIRNDAREYYYNALENVCDQGKFNESSTIANYKLAPYLTQDRTQ